MDEEHYALIKYRVFLNQLSLNTMLVSALVQTNKITAAMAFVHGFMANEFI